MLSIYTMHDWPCMSVTPFLFLFLVLGLSFKSHLSDIWTCYQIDHGLLFQCANTDISRIGNIAGDMLCAGGYTLHL